jgi:hypothetical protein
VNCMASFNFSAMRDRRMAASWASLLTDILASLGGEVVPERLKWLVGFLKNDLFLVIVSVKRLKPVEVDVQSNLDVFERLGIDCLVNNTENDD